MSLPPADPDLLRHPEIQALTQKSKNCIRRLIEHRPEDAILKHAYPSSKCAAVLVLLYEKDGYLRVLLTTRSRTLRTHPFQTALPGGRVESGDSDRIATALREANEEVGLPLDKPGLHFLGSVRPFISLYKILVTPVIMLLTDLSLLNDLEPSTDEVDHIFDHSLEAILDPHLATEEQLSIPGTELWPYNEVGLYSTSDNPSTPVGPYRMHRFRSSYTPIKGLTADILITIAEIGFDRKPSYERFAPGQLDPLAALFKLVATENAQEIHFPA